MANKRYDYFKRDETSNKFYHSSEWKRLRNRVLSKNSFCVKCGAFADVLDHIVPIKQGGLMLSESNLQPLCHKCHNEKTKTELSELGKMKPNLSET